MFTFLPVGEIDNICAAGKNPNESKERLAWEVTALIHGKEEADKAMAGAKAAFTGEGDKSSMPNVELPRAKFDSGYNAVDLFCDAGLTPSKSEGRRLIEQGGAFISHSGQEPIAVTDAAALIGADKLDSNGELILRAGKKRYCLVRAKT
jgi:tyrosyl-tRNA synthetase